MANGPFNDSTSPGGQLAILLLVIGSCIGLPTLLDIGGHPMRVTYVVSNLKQIGLATMHYSGDHDQRLPFIEPYEFGVDPFASYLNKGRGESAHENSIKIGLGDKRKPNTTQHEFRFAFAPILLEETGLTRRIVDLVEAKKPEALPIAWSDVPLRKRRIVLLFADGHVKGGLPESYRQEFSPSLVNLFPAVKGRLNYIPKDAEWPPPTWSLPASKVAEYAKQVKP